MIAGILAPCCMRATWPGLKMFTPAGFGDRDRDRDSESDFGGHGSDDGPSRADAADDWGTMKKFVPSSGAPREERGGGFGSSREPRAEGAGAWGSRFEPAPAVSGGGGRRGFDDRPGGASPSS